MTRYAAMYTPEQTAGMLGIAKSTLRKYSSLFGGYLSPAANRKSRKYTDSDIATLRQVVKLRNENIPLNEIEKHLTVVKTRPEESLMMIPAIAAEFESLHAQLARLRDDQSSEMQRIQDRLDKLEKIVTEERRSFWDRLFGRK